MNRVFVQHVPGSILLEVFIFQERGEETWIQRQRASEPPTYEFFAKEGEAPVRPRPSFYLHPGDVRQLIDKLSAAGYLPGETAQIRGELTATKAHLEDMRALVFHEIKEASK